MNKFRVLPIIGAAALAMGFASCSNEDVPASPQSDMLTFEVTLPADMATRTFSDGLNATNLNVAFYDASKTGNEITPVLSTFGTGVNASQITITPAGPLKFTVSVPLAHGVTYNVAFWADAYGNDLNSPYIFDPQAQTITTHYLSQKEHMNDNTPDAFYAFEKNISGSVANTKSVTLNRAVAQINVGALDYEAYKNISSNEITTSSYTFSEIPNAINLSTGATVSTMKDVTIAANTIPVLQENPEYFPLNRRDVVTEEIPDAPAYMAMAYVLTGSSRYLIPKFTYTFGNDNAENPNASIISNYFMDIPIQKNYRTNIYGNILTTMVNFNVEIDPMFEGTTSTSVNTVADLTSAIANAYSGATITLDSDIDNAGRINIPAGKILTIDLNGHTINDVCFVAYTGANVTFTGNGTVNGGSALAAVTAYGSTVNIKNGTFVAGLDSNGKSNSCIFSEKGGIVNISGGTFSVQKPSDNGVYFVLNRMNGSNGYFNCTGGTFINYNPENGDDNDGGNWVAEGYTVEQNGDSYTVVEK